jgi:hypothetical protein
MVRRRGEGGALLTAGPAITLADRMMVSGDRRRDEPAPLPADQMPKSTSVSTEDLESDFFGTARGALDFALASPAGLTLFIDRRLSSAGSEALVVLSLPVALSFPVVLSLPGRMPFLTLSASSS